MSTAFAKSWGSFAESWGSFGESWGHLYFEAWCCCKWRLFYVYSFSFLSLPAMLLEMVGALEHDLLRCSFVTRFGFWSFGLDLRSSLSLCSFFPPPIAGCFWLMEFVRVSSFSFLVHSLKHGIKSFLLFANCHFDNCKMVYYFKASKIFESSKTLFKNFTKGLQFL